MLSLDIQKSKSFAQDFEKEYIQSLKDARDEVIQHGILLLVNLILKVIKKESFFVRFFLVLRKEVAKNDTEKGTFLKSPLNYNHHPDGPSGQWRPRHQYHSCRHAPRRFRIPAVC